MVDRLQDIVRLNEYGGEPNIIHFADTLRCREKLDSINSVSQTWKNKLGLQIPPLRAEIQPDGKSLRLWAQGVTGFLRIGNTSLEIKPKFLKGIDDEERWRMALVRTLIVTGQGHHFDRRPTVAKASSFYLADLMAQRFLDSLSNGVMMGLPRTYVGQEGVLPYLRGRLDIKRLAYTMHLPGLIPCIYEELHEDSPLNRLFRWAAVELSKSVISPRLGLNLQELAISMGDVSAEPPGLIQAESLFLPPQYNHLEEALNIARLVLKSKSLEHAAGSSNLKGFLWNSAKVFEDFVKVLVRNVCLKHHGYVFSDTILPLGSPGLVTTRSSLTTNPDVRILMDGQTLFVLDVKYKLIKNQPKAEDVYQVMAGARVVECAICGLIYPSSEGIQPLLWKLKGAGNPRILVAVFVDVNEMADSKGMGMLAQKLHDELEELSRHADLKYST